jgi:NitT/TauT family transport system substrate-binding protein
MERIDATAAFHQKADRAGDETMPGMKRFGLVNRRQAFATVAGGISLIAAPAVVRAQAPLKVTFAQQRGLLYLPVDVMVNGGILQKEADKLGLGKIEASATALSGPGPVLDAILSGAADYGTAALPSLLTLWERTRGSANEVKAVGTVSNAMMLQMAADELWKDPHRLDHLTVALGHPDAVTALSAGYGKASITAHIAVQPFTDRGLKLPGAHIITDSRKVFGGPLTQITLLATKPTKDKNPTLFKAVANALEESIKAASGDKRAAAVLWKEAQKAPDSVDDLVAQLNDPGFEFTAQPRRIAFFADFLNRTGTMKAKLGGWKELFWETAHNQQGD